MFSRGAAITGNLVDREASGINSPYFFLSYAHSDPLAGDPDANPDELVGEFFRDLAEAVMRDASRRSGMIPGFYDQEIPVGSDWKESLQRALGAAQVFVPLYSAAYLTKSRPGQELACFRRRLELAGLDNPERRFVPVLWTPLPQAQHPPGLREALALGADEAGYTENGLRALMKIRSYWDSYRLVVNLVARKIVALAENSPIGPSEVPDLDETSSAFTRDRSLAVFAIEIAAPTARTVAVGHDLGHYGESSAEWRPFQQELPLAEYVRRVVERLDFKAEVSGIKTVDTAGTRRPGIILIDPWFIVDENGRSALESAVRELHRWVLPLLILDRPDDAHTQELADQVREILSVAGALHTDSSRGAARGVSSFADFLSVVRVLVAEAERQYLRYRSGRVPSPPSTKRPSLRGRAQPDGPAPTPGRPDSASDPLGETPDA